MDRNALRILDANLNRAREALRVIEDYARFGCDDAAVVRATKAARHALRPLPAFASDADLLAARLVEADVGRELKTAAEFQRDSPEDVAAAAFARLGESLRVVNEFAKLRDAGFAEIAERIRYEFYALAPRLLLRSAAAARLKTCGIYVIVTEALCARPWRETVNELLDVGVCCLQLREKTLPDAELLRRLRWLRGVSAAHGALLVANDRPDLACLSNAEVLHLGQDDLSLVDARRVVGNRTLVGVSTHTPEQAAAAAATLPDYLAVGPIYPSKTKPQPHVAGLSTLRAVRAATVLPLVAIGGIDATNAAEVLSAGADIICICSAVIAAPDPKETAAKLLDIAATSRREGQSGAR